MQRSALCRSRRELSNEYLLAKIGFDTAENEPSKVCPISEDCGPRAAGVDEQRASALLLNDPKSRLAIIFSANYLKFIDL